MAGCEAAHGDSNMGTHLMTMEDAKQRMETAMQIEISDRPPTYVESTPNTENYVLAQDEDDPAGVRVIFSIRNCFCAKDCSDASWSKFQPWSIDSPARCLEYAKYHLMKSGKHELSEDQAQAKIEEYWAQGMIVWNNYLDTFKDRDWYRKELAKQERSKVENAKCGGGKKRKGGGGGGGDAASSSGHGSGQVAVPQLDMQQQISLAVNVALRQALMNPKSLAEPDIGLTLMAVERSLAPADTMVQVPRETLRAAIHVLERAEASLQASVVTVVGCAKDMSSQKDVIATVRAQVQSCMDHHK